MDLLHHVLESLQVRDASLALFGLQRQWGFDRAPMPADMMVALTPITGRCLIRLPDERRVSLEAGDTGLVLGGAFSFQSDESAPLAPFLDSWALRQLPPLGARVERGAPDHFQWPEPDSRGTDEGTQRLLAVAMLVEDVARSPVLAMLPPLIRVTRAQCPLDWPSMLRAFVETELAQPQPGYKVAALHLATLFFVTLLRSHVLHASEQQAGWMRGMADRAVGHALALMHGRFTEPWTLATLSSACAMSRTNFAQRFHRLVGHTPIEYLTAVRMQAAARKLRNGEPIGTVCDAVGYGSPWAFRRAFQRRWGRTPADYAHVMRAG